MLEKYKTIEKTGNAEIIEKKSRFISIIKPVFSEDEAKSFIEETRKKYWDATHNVFAYQIGDKNEIQKFTDDGEPQGTAGKPVLDVLKGEDIKNAIIIVTRYFGGTLLGTGGLVRAYGKSAKEALLDAGIVTKLLYHQFRIVCDYTLSGKIQYEILQREYILEDTLYTDKVEFIVLCEKSDSEDFVNRMTEITSAKAEIIFETEKYCSLIDGKIIQA